MPPAVAASDEVYRIGRLRGVVLCKFIGVLVLVPVVLWLCLPWGVGPVAGAPSSGDGWRATRTTCVGLTGTCVRLVVPGARDSYGNQQIVTQVFRVPVCAHGGMRVQRDSDHYDVSIPQCDGGTSVVRMYDDEVLDRYRPVH
ncbi:MAG: hypothetical protein PUF51_05375 [Bifidobacteriaceae bacterium]|nr:hypothetical protein [Bifidobacteriaceae bacterium]